MHLEVLLEEASAEAFLDILFVNLLPAGTTWSFIVFQGKKDLLSNLEKRLKGYSQWIPEDYRIVVLIDCDSDDCRDLKGTLEAAALAARLPTKAKPRNINDTSTFVVLNRIAIEELEAWFFGDTAALVQAYPGVPATLAAKAPYRNPDAIAGGTWEALERVLQKAGYFRGGLPKIEVAREVARFMDPTNNTSASFNCFRHGLAAL